MKLFRSLYQRRFVSQYRPYVNEEDLDNLADLATEIATTEKVAFRKLARSILPYWMWPLSQDELDTLGDIQRMIENVLEPRGGIRPN